MADDKHKFITHFAVLACPHRGAINLVVHYRNKDAYVMNGHAVTESELLKAKIIACAAKPPCLTITAVTDGLAKDVKIDKSIPLLDNVVGQSNTKSDVKLTHDVHAMLMVDEGLDLNFAPDHKGLRTVGFGHLSTQSEDELKATFKKAGLDYDEIVKRKGITVDEAHSLLDYDIKDKTGLMNHTLKNALGPKATTADLNTFLGGLTEAQKGSLLSLTFQKGHLPSNVAAEVVKKPMVPGDVADQIDKTSVTDYQRGKDGKYVLDKDGKKIVEKKEFKDVYGDRAARLRAWFLGTDLVPVLGKT